MIFILPTIGIVTLIVYKHIYGFISDFIATLTTIFAIVTATLGLILLGVYSTVNSVIAKNTQIYNSLVYQMENNIYDNDIAKNLLYKEVREWNEDLAFGKAPKDNFWTGIFYPDILYDSFDFIEYKEE